MNVFEAIRESGITARQAAERCGVKVNRNSMAVCPFHKDKNPSMKIDKRYFCFGCGEKGDAIDFVAKFYGIGKKEAAVQIASDFGITFEENRGRKPPPKRKRKLLPEQGAALEKTMEKMEKAEQAGQTAHPETWFDGSKVNDVLFCEDFLAGHHMKCIHGRFFDVNGAIGDVEAVKLEIYIKISPYVTSNIAKKAITLLDALRIKSYSPPIPYQTDRIHVANGTYFLSKTFSAQKEFCMNRLPVRYMPDAPEPTHWLSFVGQLLEPEDIITLQEFMGYVLLPTTRGQKMMKSPADSYMLLRDDETAPIVIKMYELSASGRGPAAIANYLRAKKVSIPAYWHYVRGERTWQGYKGENDASSYRWFDTTVRSILQHEVYIGNLVAQRQTYIFKVGKSFVKPKEEWVVVEDVFEPIVDKELCERVQESFSNSTKARKKTGLASIFSGMVFCDTCNRRISFVPERA